MVDGLVANKRELYQELALLNDVNKHVHRSQSQMSTIPNTQAAIEKHKLQALLVKKNE
jgi:hypothetical protein